MPLAVMNTQQRIGLAELLDQLFHPLLSFVVILGKFILHSRTNTFLLLTNYQSPRQPWNQV